jgi:uncharacterized protein YggE
METMWKEVTGRSAVRIVLIIVLVILALFLFVEMLSVVQQMRNYTNPDANSITVTGEGTATAIPDTATISFTASATGADVATAQSDITTVVNNALASVQSAGISSDDVTTTDYSVSPHYTQPVCMPGGICTSSVTTSGYDVSETVSVKIHDTSKVSTVLSGLAAAKVTNISGPNFIVDDPQTTIAKARAQAIQKAQADAQTLAAQLGVHLGKIMSYSDNSNGGSGPEPMMAKATSAMMGASDAGVPSVPVGNNTYTEDISITYEIH